MTIPTSIGFVERYSDGSGVEFAVLWDADKDQAELSLISGSDVVTYPKDRLAWLTARLQQIQDEASQ
jgi:hypothetical protein